MLRAVWGRFPFEGTPPRRHQGQTARTTFPTPPNAAGTRRRGRYSRNELQKEIWPADTFVDFDQGLNNAVKRLREALNDSSENPRFIETIPRRGYRFIGTRESRARDRIRSLAVLPLENLSGDSEQEYFAEGLTEALITALAKIDELR